MSDQTKERRIRRHIQAGRFYPEDPAELRQTVEKDLDAAQRLTADALPKAVVAPHAGYTFSGPTAAWAYRQVQGRPVSHVVVLAPSHHVSLAGASIFDGDAYSTPLGEIPINREIVEDLWRRSPVFETVPGAHGEEHSLEVQLPFLQVALGEFDLAPIVVSGTPTTHSAEIAEHLATALEVAGARPGDNTLVVASSDLYHGGSDKECERSDADLAAELERLDPEAFERRAASHEIMACGAGPIGISLRVAKRFGAERCQVLHRTSSNKEFPTGSGYVVGYLAAAAV